MLEQSAELSSGVVRARQMELIRELLAHEGSWGATVVDQGTAKGALLRTFLRLLTLGHPKTAVFGTPRDAGAWLTSRVGVPATEIAAFVEWSRRNARQNRPSTSQRPPGFAG